MQESLVQEHERDSRFKFIIQEVMPGKKENGYRVEEVKFQHSRGGENSNGKSLTPKA